MLQAKKKPWIEWGFTRFNRLFLQHNFQHIKIHKPAGGIPSKKTLFIINHSSWWDSLVIFYLNDQIIKSDGFGMMHEQGIRSFPFFRSIGAYSINTNQRRHMMESLHYSTKLLEQEKTVWVFPQGEEQHLEKRPLHFFNGISYIAQQCPSAEVVPVSIYYSFEHTKKPNIYVQFGEPLASEDYLSLTRKEMTRFFESKSTQQLDQLRAMIIQEDHRCFFQI